MFDRMEIGDWLKFNAALQKKKNALRQELAEMGILKKEGKNDYDKYKYFSEAQYKELFTKLFSKYGIELSFDEIEYGLFEGEGKQSNGRMPKLTFRITDINTGFYEETRITGEGMDKGDKAGYKAYTGALKYYLANTFMVATGDDPEIESPDNRMNRRSRYTQPQEAAPEMAVVIDPKQAETIKRMVTEDQFKALEGKYGTGLCLMTKEQYTKVLVQIKERIAQEKGNESAAG